VAVVGADVQNYPSASCEDGQAVLTAGGREGDGTRQKLLYAKTNSAPSLQPAF
jgi:hypothetical protein